VYHSHLFIVPRDMCTACSCHLLPFKTISETRSSRNAAGVSIAPDTAPQRPPPEDSFWVQPRTLERVSIHFDHRPRQPLLALQQQQAPLSSEERITAVPEHITQCQVRMDGVQLMTGKYGVAWGRRVLLSARFFTTRSTSAALCSKLRAGSPFASIAAIELSLSSVLRLSPDAWSVPSRNLSERDLNHGQSQVRNDTCA
jgi:hypothetical protein